MKRDNKRAEQGIPSRDQHHRAVPFTTRLREEQRWPDGQPDARNVDL